MPIKHDAAGVAENLRFEILDTTAGPASDQIGLIVPTSLCAGEVGKLIAAKLNRENGNDGAGVSRYVALAHTEGCGASSGESEEISLRTMAGYLCHPLVRRGLLLEHGCEKTHNDAMREFFEEQGIDFSRFGYASVQLDGGLDKVTDKVVTGFHADKDADPRPFRVGLEAVRLAMTAEPGTPEHLSAASAVVAARIVHFGGTVVVPENSPLLQSEPFVDGLLARGSQPGATIAYGERFIKPGFHIMQTPTDHPVETLTGLGATGVEVMLVCIAKAVWQSHPMVPVIQVSSTELSQDLDLVLTTRDTNRAATDMLALIVRVLSRQCTPKLFAQGNTDFQMTRGLLGVSL